MGSLAHAVVPLDSAVYVAGGSDRRAARGLDAMARSGPTVVILPRAAYLHDVRAQNQDNARAQWLIAALMIAVSVLAAFNAGAMAAAERRRELVLARLCGANERS